MHPVIKLSEPLLHIKNILGESPHWHPIEQRLYWLDIEAGRLFCLNPTDLNVEYYDLGIRAGSFGFRKEGGLILATETGFGFWSSQDCTIFNPINLYEVDQGIMMNDGQVDRAGRFWAGSKGPTGTAALFKLNPDQTWQKVLPGVTISNGIDWSLDDTICYYTDSGNQTIYQYQFGPVKGALREPKVFFSLRDDPNPATPDGLCLDSAGNIWTAIWDGSKVLQLSPEGKILQEVRLPVSRPTSVAFGGSEFKDLYITTASTELTAKQLNQQPYAGDLFVFKTEISGRPANFFAG